MVLGCLDRLLTVVGLPGPIHPMVGWAYFIDTLSSVAMDNRDKSFNSNMPFRPQLPHPSRMELNWDPYAHGVTTPPPRLSPVRPPLLHLFLSVPSLPTPNLLGFYLRLQMLVIIPDLIIAWDTGNKENLAHVIWGSIALHCLGQGVGGWRHPHRTQTSLQFSTWGKVLHVTLLSLLKKVH